MTYNELKLEKGMYHITGKSFLDVLEHNDPSEQYADTPLAGLDAYERQLKRFDIRVSGPHCDRVEKFFSSTQSAVLFPEFIRRAIRSGIDQSVLSDITAVHTKVEGSEYIPGILTDTTSYNTRTTAGVALPTATYTESSTLLRLDKYGRSIHATYEAIRRQRLDAFATMLRCVGVRLSNSLMVMAIGKLQATTSTSIDAATDATITYADLTTLYGKFDEFDMTTLLASPANAAKIMALSEMREMASTQPNIITLPFGAQLRKCAGMSDNYVIGIDHRFALESVSSGDILLETDKLIETQLDVITISVRVAFRVLLDNAIHVLSL